MPKLKAVVAEKLKRIRVRKPKTPAVTPPVVAIVPPPPVIPMPELPVAEPSPSQRFGPSFEAMLEEEARAEDVAVKPPSLWARFCAWINR